MEAKIASVLLVYGPLGLGWLILLFVAWRLYRDLSAERAANAKAMHEMEERYILKAETWMREYHELSKAMNLVLEAVTRRMERR